MRSAIADSDGGVVILEVEVSRGWGFSGGGEGAAGMAVGGRAGGGGGRGAGGWSGGRRGAGCGGGCAAPGGRRCAGLRAPGAGLGGVPGGDGNQSERNASIVQSKF